MDQIEELLTRGVANIIPSRVELDRLLRSGKKLNIYLGIDPTATKIHLGHAVGLRKLRQLVDLSHKVTFLIGDFTAKVGDNSDKETERPMLTDAEIENNWQTYKAQASKILDFSQVQVVRNSEWLNKLTFADVIRLCQNYSLNDYISREIMKKKLAQGVSIRLDEGLYPIMQGYDSYHLQTDLQIGAADQTFNMQAGRVLMKKLEDKESFVMAVEYLTGTDGRKMSKSWGNAIWLDDSPNEMYGKIMSIKDELISEYFKLATNISEPDMSDPMQAKKQLAHQIVLELCGQKPADEAQKYFESTFQNKQTPTDIPTAKITNTNIVDVLVETKLASSKSEAKRLIEQKGVRINDQISVVDNQIKSGDVLSVGNRKFVKIK